MIRRSLHASGCWVAKRDTSSTEWLKRQRNDPYVRKSRAEGYRARSAYKLIEMNQKFRFLKNNTSLLDLGSSPGGWSQVASKNLTNGKILAVDILPMKSIDKVNFIQGDFYEAETLNKIMFYFNNHYIKSIFDSYLLIMRIIHIS